MEYFRLLSPWEQYAAINSAKAESKSGGAANSGKSAHLPRSVVKSCSFWFPLWCSQKFQSLTAGKSISTWEPNLFSVISKPGPWIDMPYVPGDWHLMSNRMASALKPFSKWLQLLPFRIRTPQGDVIQKKYCVANYLCLLDSINKQKSVLHPGAVWKLDISQTYYVRDLVLDSRKLNSTPVFRVKGFPEVVVVNGKVRSIMKAAGLTGPWFAPVEIF